MQMKHVQISLKERRKEARMKQWKTKRRGKKQNKQRANLSALIFNRSGLRHIKSSDVDTICSHSVLSETQSLSQSVEGSARWCFVHVMCFCGVLMRCDFAMCYCDVFCGVLMRCGFAVFYCDVFCCMLRWFCLCCVALPWCISLETVFIQKFMFLSY